MIDPEVNVLGAVLVDPSAYWKVADLLTMEDFAAGGHRRLWDAVSIMFREGAEVDALTVGERFPALAELAMGVAGGQGYSANVRTYAEAVARRATERRVVAAGQRIAGLRGDDVLGEAQRIIAACSPRNVSAVRSARAVLKESVAALTERYEQGAVLTGLPTTIPAADEKTGGLQRSDLVILAARPSVGKTAFGLQLGLAAAQAGTPTLIFSAEMSGRKIIDRALAHLSGVSLKAIKSPVLMGGDDWSRINRAGETIAGLPLWLDDSSSMTVEAIAARARQVDAEQRLGLIVIDYLQHLMPPKADTTANAIQLMTRALKGMAKQLNVPVLLLSQLNRDGADRPQLKHLRDGGSIEQDADTVIFLHRPDENRFDLIEFIVAKQRDGEVTRQNEVFLHADMAHMRFTQTEDRPNVQPPGRSGFSALRASHACDRAAGG